MWIRQRRRTGAHRCDRRAAADSAAGRRDEVPLQRAEIDRSFPKRYLDHVPGRTSICATSIRDSGHLIAPIDDAFRVEEPRRKIEIVARRAHRGRQHVAADTNLERLFGSEIVENVPIDSLIPFHDLGRLDALGRMSHD
jgi:hypothetical protein